MANFSEFIDLPYKNLGRDFDGVDCYGIVHLIYKTVKNITLPDFTELKYGIDWYKKGEDHILDNVGAMNKKYFDIVEFPYKPFDLLLFKVTNNIVNHCGMYVGDMCFIHILENRTSMISRLDDRVWERKFYLAARYKKVLS